MIALSPRPCVGLEYPRESQSDRSILPLAEGSMLSFSNLAVVLNLFGFIFKSVGNMSGDR